jgi:hypothetical protein
VLRHELCSERLKKLRRATSRHSLPTDVDSEAKSRPLVRVRGSDFGVNSAVVLGIGLKTLQSNFRLPALVQGEVVLADGNKYLAFSGKRRGFAVEGDAHRWADEL